MTSDLYNDWSPHGQEKSVVAPEFWSVVGSPARRRWVERSLSFGAAIAFSTALLSFECDDMDGGVVHNGYEGLMVRFVHKSDIHVSYDTTSTASVLTYSRKPRV